MLFTTSTHAVASKERFRRLLAAAKEHGVKGSAVFLATAAFMLAAYRFKVLGERRFKVTDLHGVRCAARQGADAACGGAHRGGGRDCGGRDHGSLGDCAPADGLLEARPADPARDDHELAGQEAARASPTACSRPAEGVAGILSNPRGCFLGQQHTVINLGRFLGEW